MDLGIQQVGVINVFVYFMISFVEYEYIFNDVGVKFCFVGIGDFYDKVFMVQVNVVMLEKIYIFGLQEGCLYWEEIFIDEG